jgi:hypothetical protein
VDVHVKEAGRDIEAGASMVFRARAAGMFVVTAAILPSLIATSRTALIPFFPSITWPPLSRKS